MLAGHSDDASVLAQEIDSRLLVARSAVIAAGGIARKLIAADVEVRAKGLHGDIVTSVDLAVERFLLEEITSAFPDDAYTAEESGASGVGAVWTWLIDPIDGTHNLRIGLRHVGICVAGVVKGRTRFAVVHDIYSQETFTAHEGATVQRHLPVGVPHEMRTRDTSSSDETARQTVSWIQGYEVSPDEPAAAALLSKLERTCHRVLKLWSPGLSFAMLAKGVVDAVIVFQSNNMDMHCGLYIARQAGALVSDLEGTPVEVKWCSRENDALYSFVCATPRKLATFRAMLEA